MRHLGKSKKKSLAATFFRLAFQVNNSIVLSSFKHRNKDLKLKFEIVTGAT